MELGENCTASQRKSLVLSSPVQVVSLSPVKAAKTKLFIWPWLAPSYLPGTTWDHLDQLCYCL